MEGSRPPPCSSFSLTMTGEDRAVMFGGLTPSGKTSKAWVLRLSTMVSHPRNCLVLIYRVSFRVLCYTRGEGGEWGGAKNDNKSMVGHIPTLSFVLTFRNNLSNFNTWYFN